MSRPTTAQLLERYRLALELGQRSTFVKGWLRVPGLLWSGDITLELVGAAARIGRMARRGRRLGRRAARRRRLGLGGPR